MDLHKQSVAAYLKASGKKPPEEKPAFPKVPRKDAPPQARASGATPSVPPRREAPAAPASADSRAEGKPSRAEIARYLVLIGKEEATKILSHLGEAEIEALAGEIAAIGAIGVEEAEQVLDRFRGLVRTTRAAPAQGGMETAQGILGAAFGPDKAAAILDKVRIAQDRQFFAYLLDLPPTQVAGVLRQEPVHVKSMVLAYLPPAGAAAIIKAMEPQEQKDTVVRLATMKRVDREVLVRVDQALKERIRQSATLVKEEVDGRSSLASIMRYLDPSTEQNLLEGLEESAPDLAADIRDRLFTIDTILLIDDRDLQKFLATMDDGIIAMLLKGKEGAIKKKILGNVSDARSMAIEDELVRLGPQRRRDVDEVTRDFVGALKILEQEGKITVRRDDDEYV